MKYKAIFFDMDGTLTSLATHQIPESASLALHLAKERGVKLFLATGRHPLLFPSAVKALPFDGYLTANGQYCYNDKEVIHRKGIPPADKKALVEFLKASPCPMMFMAENELYLNMPDEKVQKVIALLNMPPIPVKDPATCLTEDIFALLLFGDERMEGPLMQAMPGCKATRWTPAFADIIPRDGGKDIGINAILAHYGLSRPETMAFGDAQNDIAMLSQVGLGIAMGGADPEVQAAADHVTDAPEADGIWNALKQFGVI